MIIRKCLMVDWKEEECVSVCVCGVGGWVSVFCE